MILGDLPWRNLNALHKFNRTVWEEYELEHIPHKWFKVKSGTVTVKIFDIHSFFGTDYVTALRNFSVGTSEQIAFIESGKKRRDLFRWSAIRDIHDYWEIEISLLPALGEKLRTLFNDAGYSPKSWHGPGAIARMALQRHGVYDAMAETPGPVQMAARYAFAGGRFEQFQVGHAKGRVYVADINSAYPFYATKLPNLSRGKWRKTRRYEAGKFAIYHIRYKTAASKMDGPGPLFRRMGNGEVAWPNRVTGWYWAPEAALVANDPDAKFLAGWVFDESDPTDRPFEFLQEYYRRRKVLKDNGNAAEWTYKLIINSIYGQLAQRTGWNRQKRSAPRSHQLEWAGFITSACRAEVFRVAKQCGSGIVSIDTDGVTSLRPFNNLDSGENLGQWELKEWDDGIFWQSGIYMLRKDNEWKKAKTRGIPKGSYSAEDLLSSIATGEPLRMSKNMFVGYGLACNGRREELNTWNAEPHEFVFGGTGKRVHVRKACKFQCGRSGGMHKLSMLYMLYGPDGDPHSIQHYLPWLDNGTLGLAQQKGIMDDYSLFGLDEEEWVRDVSEKLAG